MSRVVALVVLLLAPTQAHAIGGSIGVFSDGSATNCGLMDATGVVTLAIVHVLSDGSVGCEYSAPPPPCANWTFLDETPNYGAPNPGVFQGSSPIGASVGYGTCLFATPPNPVVAHITTMRFSSLGTSSSCCLYTVRDHPGFPATTPISVTCRPFGRETEPASGGQAIINSNPTCSCTVPSEETTWGVIKSLYSN